MTDWNLKGTQVHSELQSVIETVTCDHWTETPELYFDMALFLLQHFSSWHYLKKSKIATLRLRGTKGLKPT